MKRLLLTFGILLISGILFSQSKVKVKVIYFHSTHRCPTCIAIETTTRKTLDKYFRTEMEKGLISFSVINIDDKVNRKIAEDYQVYGSSLFLVQMLNGRENKNNLTDFAFTKVRNETEFMTELKTRIEQLLK